MTTTERAAAVSLKMTTMILAKVAEGMPIRQAVDAVCGAGTVERLAGEIWEANQPKK